ncbi:hypothetical protein SDC9_201202 [bioreactor metagenome]|uniref:Uncharacterized protein n=1 Tax=bioreactor metagenome TaxID=1076179 RepID=A0A645IQ94_9ZZZZ
MIRQRVDRGVERDRRHILMAAVVNIADQPRLGICFQLLAQRGNSLRRNDFRGNIRRKVAIWRQADAVTTFKQDHIAATAPFAPRKRVTIPKHDLDITTLGIE